MVFNNVSIKCHIPFSAYALVPIINGNMATNIKNDNKLSIELVAIPIYILVFSIFPELYLCLKLPYKFHKCFVISNDFSLSV